MANTIPNVNLTGLDGDEAPFQSDAIRHPQVFQERQGSGALKPFTRLTYAILIDAVRCYQVNFDARRPSKKQQFSEAHGWLFHNECIGHFSFQRVCDAADEGSSAGDKHNRFGTASAGLEL
jgi:hypothetical protein